MIGYNPTKQTNQLINNREIYNVIIAFNTCYDKEWLHQVFLLFAGNFVEFEWPPEIYDWRFLELAVYRHFGRRIHDTAVSVDRFQRYDKVFLPDSCIAIAVEIDRKPFADLGGTV